MASSSSTGSQSIRSLLQSLLHRACPRRLSRFGKRNLLAGALTLGACFASPSAYAQVPTGGTIQSGTGTIATAGPVMDISTTSSRAVIDWTDFSIDAASTVNFNQPGIDSAVLNRVTSAGTPSVIDGIINSNGAVFLTNPSGVTIGATGVITTNGFTASTFDIDPANFMAGKDFDFTGTSSASITNAGTITTLAGGIHLVAEDILNTGTLESTGGVINMATGGTIRLPNGATYVQADIASTASGISGTAALIKNSGTIRVTGALAVGGEVYLVNPHGDIVTDDTIIAQITRPDTELIGGKVTIDASGGTANIAGTVEANGKEGGTVSITGTATQLNTATVDASGEEAGGEVLVGGGLDGLDSRIANSATTSVNAGSSIDASATVSGDAGKIRVWSDGATTFAGTATATSNTGTGGNIQVFGSPLSFSGTLDVSSTSGVDGESMQTMADLIIDDTNVDFYRQSWGSGDLTLEAGDSITILADLFPTDGSDEKIVGRDGIQKGLIFREGTGGNGFLDINIGAEITESRNSFIFPSFPTSLMQSNGGTFEVTSDGSVSVQGELAITSADVSLEGRVYSTRDLTLNAYDAASATNTANVAIGTNAAGDFQLSDTELGHFGRSVTINGGDFDFDSTATFTQHLTVHGQHLNFDSYVGRSLDLNGTDLVVAGPITGSGMFRYVGPGSQTIGLGSATGSDVTLSESILAGITGFWLFEIGNSSPTSSTLTATDADLSEFRSVTLNGSSVLLDSVSIQQNLTLNSQDISVANAVTKSSDRGSLSIAPIGSAALSFGLGDGTAGDNQVTQQELIDLGKYDSLFIKTNNGDMNVNVDLRTAELFSSSVRFDAGAGVLAVDNLQTATNFLELNSSDLIVAIDPDSNVSTQVITNNAAGTLQLKSDNASTMKIGEGSAGNWTLDTDEISEITGFANLAFSNDTSNSTISIENADLTGITEENGGTTFTSDHFSVSGADGLKIDGRLNVNAQSSLAIDGPIQTLSTVPVAASIRAENSLGLGEHTSGVLQLDQAELEQFQGFAALQFSAVGVDVDANFNEDLTINSFNNQNVTIGDLTQTTTGKSTSITGNRITGDTITSDGDITLSGRFGIGGSPALNINSGDIGGTNADGNVSLSSSQGDIDVKLTAPNDGTVSASASQGSIDIATTATTKFGALTLHDSDNSFAAVGASNETLKIETTQGDLIFTAGAYVDGLFEVTAPGKIQTKVSGRLSTEYSHFDENPDVKLVLNSGTGIEHIGEDGAVSGFRLGTAVVEATTSQPNANIWLDSRYSGTLYLNPSNSAGNLAVDAENLVVQGTQTVAGHKDITLRTMGDLTVQGDVLIAGTGDVNLIAGWDGTTNLDTPFDVDIFKSQSFGTTLFGRREATVLIDPGASPQQVAVGSRNGETNVFSHDLTVQSLTSANHRAQLGYRLDTPGSADGSIDAVLMGSVVLDALHQPTVLDTALIGHGAPTGTTGSGTTVSGDIHVGAADSVSITHGTVGHQAGASGVYASGNTNIAAAVDRESPGPKRLDLNHHSVIQSAPNGELRIYISKDASGSVSGSALVNGVLGSTFNSEDPLPNTGYAPAYEGEYLGTSTQNWTFYIGLIEIIVNALDGSSIYGDAPVNPGMELVDGTLLTGDTLDSIGLTTSFNVTPTTNVGEYTVSVDDSKLDVTYRLKDTEAGTFTVNPAPLTISALDIVKDFRDNLQFDDSNWTSEGLKNNETIGSVTLESAGSGEDAQIGFYAIEASNPEGGTFSVLNYDISYKDGNLIVAPNNGYFSHEVWTRAQSMATSVQYLFDQATPQFNSSVPPQSGASASLGQNAE